jgi:L-alanine-DL-glutamate epimerase-like enolase superfamily enzyme
MTSHQPALIRNVEVYLNHAKLHAPYVLSFTTLDAFESVAVAVERVNGVIGIGEAVALPGYGSETTADVISMVRRLIDGAAGQSATNLLRRCRDAWREAPFAASAVATALEQPDWLRHANRGSRFPLNCAVSSEGGASVLTTAARHVLDRGYRYLKLKVGRDLDADIASARLLLDGLAGARFQVVIDANQAYSRDEARAFITALERMDAERLLWFEQPLDRFDWDGLGNLCRDSRRPIVLDECIYDEADVRRAAACGAHGVKLKLCKNLSPSETIRLAELARALDMVVVFGNGVATDLGNLTEHLVLAARPDLFAAPSESSGFAKLRRTLTNVSLRIDASGCLTCADDPAMVRAHLCASLHGLTPAM